MKALVYKGKNKVEIGEIDEPKISKPTDAILRISSTGICGSDLHMFEGGLQWKKAAVWATRSWAKLLKLAMLSKV